MPLPANEYPHIPLEPETYAALKREATRRGRLLYSLASEIVDEYLATRREALRNGGKVPKGKGRGKQST